ncbi:MAG: hypothetical protein QW156_04660 [Candidatus Aenigmatarchaeota archaeon]
MVKAHESEPDELIRLSEQVEKRINAMKIVKKSALKLTNEKDWVNQNGKPYLQSSGAEKIARQFSISWRFVGEPRKEVFPDGHFQYIVTMEFMLGNSTIEVMGIRSSKDPFFSTRYKEGNKIELPSTEIDSGDVLKSAISNAITNGVTRILGLREIEWDDLKQAGIDISRIQKIEYKTQPQQKKQEQPQQKHEQKQGTGQLL